MPPRADGRTHRPTRRQRCVPPPRTRASTWTSVLRIEFRPERSHRAMLAGAKTKKLKAKRLGSFQRGSRARRPRRRGTRAKTVSFSSVYPHNIYLCVFFSLLTFFFPFFCSTENFYREKEKKKKKLWVEAGKSFYQERHCKRVKPECRFGSLNVH